MNLDILESEDKQGVVAIVLVHARLFAFNSGIIMLQMPNSFSS